MIDYNLFADMLNKYSQLTPWVQALIGLYSMGATLGIAYFIKEMVAVIVCPFQHATKTISADSPKEMNHYRRLPVGSSSV